MNGLSASNFKRIHLGLLLDLILLFLIPGVMSLLLTFIYRQVSAAGMNGATVEMLLQSPSLAVRALYSFLALQYCAGGLCALISVSGIGGTETVSRHLRRAKHAFLALTLTDAAAMITHISDVLLPGSGRIRLVSVAFIASILLILFFRGFALRSLMLGLGEILNSFGEEEQSARASALSAHITAAIALLLICLLAAFTSALLNIRTVRWLLMAGTAAALAYYIVVFIFIIRYIRKACVMIAAISE